MSTEESITEFTPAGKWGVILVNGWETCWEVNPDVVKVIRCKDCKHHQDEEVGMVYCPNIVGGWVINDFFCAYGERRDDAEKID